MSDDALHLHSQHGNHHPRWKISVRGLLPTEAKDAGASVNPIELIEKNREIMEHATMAFVGVEYLASVVDDDTILLDELSPLSPDWGNQEDALNELRLALAWIIARKAADVHRIGNGLPMPKDERKTDV